VVVWIAVEEDALDAAGRRVADAAQLLAGVDLSGLASAVVSAMPGSRSAAVTESTVQLQRELVAVVAVLAQESARLRLAATEYAAAESAATEAVARVMSHPSPLGPAAQPVPSPSA